MGNNNNKKNVDLCKRGNMGEVAKIKKYIFLNN
jgi:hypothetical protein